LHDAGRTSSPRLQRQRGRAHHQRDQVARQRLAQDLLLALLGEQLRLVEAEVARRGDLFVVDERSCQPEVTRT
jgi:hypothetical protein